MKCNDCGNEIKQHSRSHRQDVCDPCWEMRGKLVTGKIPEALPGSEAFKKIQKKMQNGRGTAKRYIDSIRAVNEPQI